jgi:hypothetical protein
VSRLFGKLDASRHLIAPCAIAGEAIATAPLVAARRAKFRREIVMYSSLAPRGDFEPAVCFDDRRLPVCSITQTLEKRLKTCPQGAA